MTTIELQREAYALYMFDLTHLHPGVQPVSFKRFCEHARKDWQKDGVEHNGMTEANHADCIS